MYTVHFGCRERPFDITVDPRFLYVNPALAEAYAAILQGVQDRRGCIALVGEAGTGKTTLLSRILDALEEPNRAVFFDKTTLTFEELLDFVCLNFGLRVQNGRLLEKIQALNNFLLERQRAGGTGVLIVDEAQNLSEEVLENLRLLSNFEAANEKLLQLVLVGQPEFELKLEQPALRQLKQRIVVRCRLERLSPQEISPFLLHRLRVAGCERQDLFTPDAIARIAVYSTGIPRLVNVICDNAMLIAYGARSSAVSREIIEEVAQSLQLKEEARPAALSSAGSTYEVQDITIFQRDEATTSNANSAQAQLFTTLQFSNSWLKPALWLIGIVLISELLVRFEIFPITLRHNAARIVDLSPSAPLSTGEQTVNAFPQPQEERDSRPPALQMTARPPAQKSETSSPATSLKETDPKRPNTTTSFLQTVDVPVSKWKGETIVIARGDTISRLALKMYGSSNTLAFDLIKELNPHIEDLNRVVIGDKILFPALTHETLLRRQPDGSYQLIAGSFPSEHEAEKVAQAARKEGFIASVTQQKVFGPHSLYRVSLEELRGDAVIKQAWLQVASGVL